MSRTGAARLAWGAWRFDVVVVTALLALETDAHGFFKLAEPVFARMARRDFAGNFETLKDVLEARNDSRTHGP